MGRMSREKGKRGERCIASMFRDAGFDNVHRTAQYKGKTGDAGDIEGIPGIHAEVKFQERMCLYDWMSQAVHDAEADGSGNLPTVFHKQNNKDVLVTMRFSDWIEIYKAWEADISEV